MSSDEEEPVRPAVAAAAEEGGSSSSSDDEIAEEVAQAAEMRRSGSAAALEGGQAQLNCPLSKRRAMPRPLCDWRAAAGEFSLAGHTPCWKCGVLASGGSSSKAGHLLPRAHQQLRLC